VESRVRQVRSLAISAAIMLVLGGCGLQWFIPPKENPVIGDYLTQGPGGPPFFTVLSNTPERRLTVAGVQPGTPGFGRICSEGQADVAETLSATAEAVLDASKGDTKVGAEAAKTLATAVQALAPRSQGVIFYRDVTFSNCLEHLNGVISAPELEKKNKTALEHAVALISHELDKNNGKIGHGPPPGRDAPQKAETPSSEK